LERKPPEDLAPLLAKAQVLGPLTEERALWLARRVPELRLERAQILYGPELDSRIIFALLEGRVRLYKVLGDAELTLEVIEAGQFFGDVPALAGRQRGTYAEALEPSRVAMVSVRVLHQLAQENPEVGIKLAELLAGRLYEYRERMADVALKKVSARLASILLRLLETEGVVSREGDGIRTRYTHEQLATMIGARRVAVSRAMGVLRRIGAVEVKGRRVYLKDQAVLRRAAEVGQREA
jgi:CRP/FNR family transcriptional regulator, cyclic AMP receptor protein